MVNNQYLTGTRYYYLPDDGALFTCNDCGEQSPGGHTGPRAMVVVITPSGYHSTLHLECVEPHWLAAATLTSPEAEAEVQVQS